MNYCGKKGAGPVNTHAHPAFGSAHAASYDPAKATAGQAAAKEQHKEPAAAPQNFVKQVMAKQMAERDASLLANLGKK